MHTIVAAKLSVCLFGLLSACHYKEAVYVGLFGEGLHLASR